MLPNIRAVIAAAVTALGLLTVSFGMVAAFRVAQDDRVGFLHAELTQRGRQPVPISATPRTILIVDTPAPVMPTAPEDFDRMQPVTLPAADLPAPDLPAVDLPAADLPAGTQAAAVVQEGEQEAEAEPIVATAALAPQAPPTAEPASAPTAAVAPQAPAIAELTSAPTAPDAIAALLVAGAPVGGPFEIAAASPPEMSPARKAAAQKAARAAAARKVRAARLARDRRMAARRAAQARQARPSPFAPYDWNSPQANSFSAFSGSFGDASRTPAAAKTPPATKRAAGPSVGLPSCAQNQAAGCR